MFQVFINVMIVNQKCKEDKQDAIFSLLKKKKKQLIPINVSNNVAEQEP